MAMPVVPVAISNQWKTNLRDKDGKVVLHESVRVDDVLVDSLDGDVPGDREPLQVPLVQVGEGRRQVRGRRAHLLVVVEDGGDKVLGQVRVLRLPLHQFRERSPDLDGEPPDDLVDLEVEGVGVPGAELGDEGLAAAGEVGPLAVRVVPRRVHDEAEDGAHGGAQLAPALAQPHNLGVGIATCDRGGLNLGI